VPTQNARQLVKDPNGDIDGNAVYISSVSYGRIGYLSIKSSLSTEDIKVAVDAIYSDPTMKVGVKGRVSISNFLSNSEINGFTYGGNPVTVTNINDFFTYIRNGDVRDNNIPIKPIFYKTKYIKSGKDAFVSMATDYNEVQCEPYKQFSLTLRGVSLNSIHNGDCTKAWGNINVEVWETANGELSKRILPLTDAGRVEDVTSMMEWPNYGQVTNIADYTKVIANFSGGSPGIDINNVSKINNVNKTWSFKINPDKINNNEAVVIVKTYLGSQHKSGDFTTDYIPNAGMGGTEQKKLYILDWMNKEVEVGPYTSTNRADHQFRAHFKFGVK
jgi:Thiol-activated cytolysin